MARGFLPSGGGRREPVRAAARLLDMTESLFPPAADPSLRGAQHDPLAPRRRRWPWVLLIVAVVIVATIVAAAGISALRGPGESCGCTGPIRPSPTVTGAGISAVPSAVTRAVVHV